MPTEARLAERCVACVGGAGAPAGASFPAALSRELVVAAGVEAMVAGVESAETGIFLAGACF